MQLLKFTLINIRYFLWPFETCRFHHLYPSNQNTETNPTRMVMPNCIPFREAILKKRVIDGTKRIMASSATVTKSTTTINVFLYCNVVKTE